ncbi:MAG TPA: ATP-dependent zinc metalloprotease FtsH [Bacillota bacterium]|nr:ATP-dependent zinc metalloprotease FtsH [Bacillota bacterium]HPZ14194.1 ATP-dependent zinc metalloprotease FtsH [Bacillota bacterium]HQD80309.1 ATP-dependent zinc metalloprotease FtsH [Bacillota bacterium]
MKSLALWLLLGLIAISISNALFSSKPRVDEITASQFMQYWQEHRVEKLQITGENSIKGTLDDGSGFKLYYPDVKGLVEDLRNDPDLANQVELSMVPEGQGAWWIALIPNIISIILLFVVFFFIMNQVQGGGNKAMQFGKSRAQLQTSERGKVTFQDVAGIDEVVDELEEVVDYLKHPKRYIELGARIPRGILLVGPPGTGKTLLAKAVAGEADVPFFSVSGSDFVEMFVGVGASRVRDMFNEAKRNAPCIIFIDEIDAVGRQRGAGLGGGHDEREQTLNQLLFEMDGFDPNSGVIVLAATNRPDILDSALLRPGRFDRQIVVDVPDQKGREEILKVHARNKPLDPEVDLKAVAQRTPGFTGADLANLLNESALLSARNNKKKIGTEEISEAIERLVAGPAKKGRIMGEREKNLVAYHEAGHAILGHMLPDADPVVKVSIIGRGRAGGYTLMIPEDDRRYRYATKNEMFNEIVVALGGRVAEEIVLGEISTGAQNDLERASKTARKMVMEYGMSDLGPITYGRSHEEQIFLGRDIARDRNYSEEVASRIDAEVHSIVTEAYNMATEMLTQNMDKLHLLATALKERETIEGEELDALLSDDNGAQDSDYGADKSDAGLGSVAAVGGSQPEEAKSGIAAIEERLKAGKQRDPGPEGAPA